jgi:glutathione S-transferase
MIGHSIMMSHRMGIVNENHPNLMAYIERLNARPALQKAFSFDTI